MFELLRKLNTEIRGLLATTPPSENAVAILRIQLEINELLGEALARVRDPKDAFFANPRVTSTAPRAKPKIRKDPRANLNDTRDRNDD